MCQKTKVREEQQRSEESLAKARKLQNELSERALVSISWCVFFNGNDY